MSYKRDRSESKSYSASREEEIKIVKALIEEHEKDVVYYKNEASKYMALARDESEKAWKLKCAIFEAQSRLKELEDNEEAPLSISPGFHWERQMEDEERAAKRYLFPQVIFLDGDDNANDGEIDPTFMGYSDL